MFGTILGSKLDPFGCHMGYVLRVPPPLRHEMVVPCFSDASDITKQLENHGFFDGFAISAKVVLAIQIFPKTCQNDTEIVSKNV